MFTAYTTPSTVREVSATFVATMKRRQFGGAGANTLTCMRSVQNQKCCLAWKMFKPNANYHIFHTMYLIVASFCCFQVELIIEYIVCNIQSLNLVSSERVFFIYVFHWFQKSELNICLGGWMHICLIACGQCRFFMCFTKND